MQGIAPDLDLAAIVDPVVAVGEARVTEVAALAARADRTPVCRWVRGSRTAVLARTAVVRIDVQVHAEVAAPGRARRADACTIHAILIGPARVTARATVQGIPPLVDLAPIAAKVVVAVAKERLARQLAGATFAAPRRIWRLDLGPALPLRIVTLRSDAARPARPAVEVVRREVLALLATLAEAAWTTAGSLPADRPRLADVAAAAAVVRVVPGEHLTAVNVLVVAVGGELVTRERALAACAHGGRVMRPRRLRAGCAGPAMLDVATRIRGAQPAAAGRPGKRAVRGDAYSERDRRLASEQRIGIYLRGHGTRTRGLQRQRDRCNCEDQGGAEQDVHWVDGRAPALARRAPTMCDRCWGSVWHVRGPPARALTADGARPMYFARAASESARLRCAIGADRRASAGDPPGPFSRGACSAAHADRSGPVAHPRQWLSRRISTKTTALLDCSDVAIIDPALPQVACDPAT